MAFRGSVDEITAENRNGLLSSHASWERVRLAEVAAVLNGFAFKSSLFAKEAGVPLLRIRDVLRDSTEATYTGEYDPTYLALPGELVIGMDGDFNCALWAGPKAVLNQRVCKVSPDERFYDRRFLAYALPGYLSAINAETSSVTVKHLSSKTVQEIPLPLPPLPEQRRIVEEIEKQFTRLDAAVESLERARANLKRYRASVLAAACEGRLVPTEAELARQEDRDYEPATALLDRILTERRARWEADELAKLHAKGKPPKNGAWKSRYNPPTPTDATDLPELPEGWVWTSLASLLTAIEAGKSFKCEERPPEADEVGVVKVSAVSWGEYAELKSKTCIDPNKVIPDYFVNPGDFLFSRANTIDLVGACVIAKHVTRRIMLSDKILRFRFAMTNSDSWTLYFLRSTRGRSEIERLATGNQDSMRNIGQDRIRRIRIPLPPLAEQQRIVEEVERRLSVVEEMERTVEADLQRAGRLRQAILKRAFEGRLVPQDPTDEPASALLERIRAEREQANPPSRSRRSGKARKSQPAMQPLFDINDENGK